MTLKSIGKLPGLLCLLLFVSVNSYADSLLKEDSLMIQLNRTKEKKERYSILMALIKHTRTYDYKKSILYSTQGELLASNRDDKQWLAKFLFEGGVTNYYLTSYDTSLDKYLKATKYFETNNDFISLTKCYNNTGMIYDRIEKYEKAVQYYQLAIASFNRLDDKTREEYIRFLPQHYNNIASAYNKLKQTNKAQAYYKKALEVALNIDFRYILGAIYNNLGIVDMEKELYPSAKQYFDQSILIRQEDNETIGLAQSYNILSQYYMNIADYDSCIWASKKSLEISSTNNLLELQKSSHYRLITAYEKKGMLAEALQEQKNYSIINDSIGNSHKMNRLTQLEIAQEVEKIEKANKVKLTKLKYQYAILLLILFSLAIISILTARLYKIQKKKLNLEYSKLKLSVDTKNRELTTNVMQLIQKNELINNVVKELLTLKNDINNKSQQTLHKIILNLQSQTNKEIWQEFEFRFNNVHTDFYSRLMHEHPSITASEKRLCALLRLNMTSKEIAAITHQTLRGVEVARSRLRKRLCLTRKDTSLNSYLENF
ncbi:tetratricopeptide repeat protein [Carboxylicivirga sp. M1479]|uniref:tetratricopeptide repeat protein n=1 Tax=Carboxylicivirga sp. M1479 TaxID=2594476 RepID=UPI0011780957|nr:tetratricopeptide repeat protein [Carboxylicivirga sp. M1479]TRX66561.1 tetratricopeptide repeat protein [Carboxylicivirga sp. M1479]